VRERVGADVVWGVEDCRNLTALLEQDLLAAGQRVIRVPPHLMSRTRASARERGKSDPIDALAVARAVLREPDLPVASHDAVSMELRLLVDRREDLIRLRVTIINRMLARTHQLDPAWGKPINWDARKPREAMGAWLAAQEGLQAELARDELEDIVRLTHAAHALAARIGERIRIAAPALLELQGCGELTAAKLVAEVAGIERFKSEAAFARHAGVAPFPHWSANSARPLRPMRHGNRQLNAALHRIAMVQIIHGGPGRQYFERRIAEGDSRQRALRSLKRRIARVVFNRMRVDRGLTSRRSSRIPLVFLLPLVELSEGRQNHCAGGDEIAAHPLPNGRRRALEPYQVLMVCRLRTSGAKVPQIARTLKVSNSTVKRALAGNPRFPGE
jgi:transposase